MWGMIGLGPSLKMNLAVMWVVKWVEKGISGSET